MQDTAVAALNNVICLVPLFLDFVDFVGLRFATIRSEADLGGLYPHCIQSIPKAAVKLN
jgi:hypothetical protein